MLEREIVYELKRKLERERYQRLMSLSDDELRRLNSNERLGLTGHTNAELKARSLDEKRYIQSWQYLDDLGAEYQEFVKQGHGTSVENRNERQLEIAEIIVRRSTPYISSLVYRLVRGTGIKISNKGKKSVVHIYECNTQLEELISEGVAAVINNLHKYVRERANIAKFIDHIIINPIRRKVNMDLEFDERYRDSNDNDSTYQQREDIEEMIDRNTTIQSMQKALAQLSNLEQKLLKQRYGLSGDRELTLREVGKRMGISHQRVKQIEARALNRLRNIL